MTPATAAKTKLPAGPPIPTPLQAAIWALRPLELMDRCEARYGEIFTLRIRRGRPWVLLTNPAHVKQVFTRASELMGAGAGEANPLLEPLLGPRSVMLLDEPQHMGDRKRLLPSFHGGRMKDYGAMMSEIAEEKVADWPTGEPFELWPRMQSISMEVVMRSVFDGIAPDRAELLRERIAGLTNWINQPRRLALLAAFGSRSITANSGFRREMDKLEAVVLDEVRLRRARGVSAEEADIFSMLERGHAESGEPASEEKMRDELVTMLSDGPTATSLAWVFERLLRYPKKLARLREEVLRGEGGDYLDAVVKETLRLCPAVPLVMRRLIKPMELGGYMLPAGTIVAPCIYLMHRRGDIYPEPLEFEPERFLGGADAGAYTWIPFGGGVRRCVAASFAQLEIKRVIEVVLRELDLRPATEGDEEAARSSVSFAPGGGARVIASRRAPQPPVDRQPLAA
ncbi:MAG TPA: cytochrome P450 [Solirubrobacteraceae bacterium]|nr:cytochrome P450 [Solirubrobacteraceae bacterium]